MCCLALTMLPMLFLWFEKQPIYQNPVPRCFSPHKENMNFWVKHEGGGNPSQPPWVGLPSQRGGA